MSLDQNPHQTVTRFGCFEFPMYVCGFSVPQMVQFCLFTYPPRLKWASSEKMIFYMASYQGLSKIRLDDVSEMFNCWERRSIDVDGASHTLSPLQQYSRVYTLFLAFHALVYRWGCQFLSLFSHIQQHYHDFQSNVAIFPNIVQAYTQPYSFGGRIKLIICPIRPELNYIIHEISKRYMADHV